MGGFRPKNALGTSATTSGQLQYYYAWRGGPPLAGMPGSPEFIKAFNDAFANRKLDRPSGTLRWLVDAFRDSETFFRGLSQKTAKDYRRILSRIDAEFGNCPLTALKDPRIRGDFLKWRDDLARTAPRSADYTLNRFCESALVRS
jgi:hypothetical protein